MRVSWGSLNAHFFICAPVLAAFQKGSEVAVCFLCKEAVLSMGESMDFGVGWIWDKY